MFVNANSMKSRSNIIGNTSNQILVNIQKTGEREREHQLEYIYQLKQKYKERNRSI